MIFNKATERGGITPVLLHCHLFKNSGSTIDWALRRSFMRGFVNHRDDREMAKGGMEYVEKYLANRKRVIAISSHHMPFDPYYQSTNYAFWHIIMLRHPIARTVSVYEYEKIQPPVSLGARKAKELDMRSYFEWRMRMDSPAVLRNYYTRYLTNKKHPAQDLRNQDFEEALLRCALPNVLIGIVERFDESMVLFENSLKAHFQKLNFAYIKQNQNFAVPKEPIEYLREKLGCALFSELNDKNTLDSSLYEKLSVEFGKRIERINDFQECLAEFKVRCNHLQAA
jgi:hypothetical protein